MNFNLLKEFLESGLTNKKFANYKGVSGTCIGNKLKKEMRKLLSTNMFDAKSIVGDSYISIYDARKYKENWLKAIYAYERGMLEPVSLDTRKISELTVSEFLSILSKK